MPRSGHHGRLAAAHAGFTDGQRCELLRYMTIESAKAACEAEGASLEDVALHYALAAGAQRNPVFQRGVSA